MEHPSTQGVYKGSPLQSCIHLSKKKKKISSLVFILHYKPSILYLVLANIFPVP